MLEKMKIKSEIKKCVKEINTLEQKRIRSQAALVEALLRHETPTDEDTDYFNTYTDQIEKLRAHIRELNAMLEK